eukprot:scaffold5074_cov99-Cylindrotheca_fusiformis.AAC.7
MDIGPLTLNSSHGESEFTVPGENQRHRFSRGTILIFKKLYSVHVSLHEPNNDKDNIASDELPKVSNHQVKVNTAQ